MPAQKSAEIIVAGGGIAGAAIAIFLSRLHVHVTILESRPGRLASTEGSVLMLGPNGMNVLNGIGLARTLLERDHSGAQVPWITVKDAAGGLIGKMPQGSEQRHGFAPTMVMRSDLHDVLLDEVEKRQLRIDWGAQVQSGQGDVKLLLCMYNCLGMPIPKPEYSGLVGIGGLIDIDNVPGLSSFLTPDQPFVMMQGRRGFVGMVIFDKAGKKVGWWTSHEAPNRTREEWKIPKTQALLEIQERYLDWAFPVPQLIAAAEACDNDLIIWPMFQVPKLEHWHSRRTVLIGDAAHAMPPHSGQGASQVLEDAGYLAYLLRRQIESDLSSDSGASGLDWTSVLATFQLARQHRVSEIVNEANRRGNQRKDRSAVRYFIGKWMMWAVFLFARESWGDDWFGYKVPGIDDW